MLRSRLQLFAEAVAGKKIVYLYRVKENSATDDAKHIAFTTENGRTKSKDEDSVATKDGTIRVPGTSEVEITATSVMAKGDAFLGTLESALDSDKILEIWEVNLEEKGTTTNSGKFKSKYFQGYLTEMEVTSSAEDMAEVSLTFGIIGAGVDGYATVTDEQQEAAAYVFVDTQKTGA